eukprot:867087-Rhodomonas_salina.1
MLPSAAKKANNKAIVVKIIHVPRQVNAGTSLLVFNESPFRKVLDGCNDALFPPLHHVTPWRQIQENVSQCFHALICRVWTWSNCFSSTARTHWHPIPAFHLRNLVLDHPTIIFHRCTTNESLNNLQQLPPRRDSSSLVIVPFLLLRLTVRARGPRQQKGRSGHAE